MPLREGMPLYPGSPPFRREATCELARGAVVNESLVTIGTHCGTHVDAPRHFLADGAALDELALERFVGPARLFDLSRVDRIDRADLERLDWRGVERALFKTRNSRHWARGGAFDPSYVHVTAAAAEFLVARRVKLVGIDGLGIERFRSSDHRVHLALLRAGIPILEGLCLSPVPSGDYQLFCGVLPLASSDGAPARVLLIEAERGR
jgi:arylformamidase